MTRAALSAAVVVAALAFVVLAGGASSGTAGNSYRIELDNAFGLVTGADFKVAGVPAGTISQIGLDQKTLHAVVTVQVTRSGFGQFHTDASCQSRPQSLIGEYFIDCDPGSSGPVLASGGTIPVSQTQSTIPADLIQNILRLPYRQRLTLVVNELGAAAAARSGDLQAALRRAVPALTDTDSLLNLLAQDSGTIQKLTADANAVITALADDGAGVQRFIIEADRTTTATATQQANLRATLARLPGLLAELRPYVAQLGTTVTTNTPVLENLDAASTQIDRLVQELPGFARSARPAIGALGTASVTGRTAVIAAKPTVAALNTFAKPTPELAQNLAIVVNDLDNPARAVEADPASPGGRGFTGLEALLGYVFNQTLAINSYTPQGHILAVDAFVSAMCSQYATPATVALAIKAYGSAYRQCYSWLGPNQPGVNEPDPSDPGATVPDPGGEPPGQTAKPTAASANARTALAPGAGSAAAAATTGSSPASPAAPSGAPAGGQTAALLDYLLSP